MPTISSATSADADGSSGTSRLTATATARAIRMGSRAPRRSDSRPATGDRHDSIAAAARKVPPMIVAVAPS